MAKKDTRLLECIPVNKRVAVALWRLATGDMYRSIGLPFGRVNADFCKAIAKRASYFIKFPETLKEELTQNIRLFPQKSPFPEVVGAIDGSHIPLKTVPVND